VASYEGNNARVVFGAGSASLARDEMRRLGGRALLISSASSRPVAETIVAGSDDIVARIGDIRQHVPVADAERARERCRTAGAQVVLAVGGGSAIGLAKAIALTEPVTILAIPTTYSGSEMTSAWGITENGVKLTGRDLAVVPRAVIYDPELTLSLSPDLTAASGFNALAHCVEALWAPDRSPLSDAIAEAGITKLAAALPAAVRDGANAAARESALAGAWFAGIALAAAGAGVHHKICHVLGGRFDLPHAPMHAAVLPWSTAAAVRHIPSAAARIAGALGAEDAVDGLRRLGAELGVARTLADLGLTEAQALAVADEIEVPPLSPAGEVSRDQLRELLLGATLGDIDG